MAYLIVSAAVMMAAALIYYCGKNEKEKGFLLLLPMKQDADLAELRLRWAKSALKKLGPGCGLFVLDQGMDAETRSICLRFVEQYGGQMGDMGQLQVFLQQAKPFAWEEKI